ncbi:MAG: Heat shock protein, partial [Parcubacteria group bacterium GW2011_GWC2_38_7]
MMRREFRPQFHFARGVARTRPVGDSRSGIRTLSGPLPHTYCVRTQWVHGEAFSRWRSKRPLIDIIASHRRTTMTWLKRMFLFMAVNLLVIVTLSVTLQVLGVRPYLSARGLDYNALMMFCLVWGMGGAFISLGLSRVIAKWSMGVKVIDPQNAR